MLQLEETARAWDSPAFEATLKAELERLGPARLPLQAALQHSSHAHDAPIRSMLIKSRADAAQIHVDVGIFYAGVIAGCNCADDPSPIEAQPEYCVLRLVIDRLSGNTDVCVISE